MKRLAWFFSLWLASSPAWACRCAQQDLATYFDAASEVGIGRFVSSRTVSGDQPIHDRRLTFELLAPLHKSPRSKPLRSGELVEYMSSNSSASCGVAPRAGDIFVLFAKPLDDHALAIDTCNGTRLLQGLDDDGGANVFHDVPIARIESQLNALAGLGYLHAMANAWPDVSNTANESLIGLLHIKGFSETGETDVAGVPLLGSPDETASTLTTINNYNDIDAKESGYEVLAAVVFAQSSGWFRLRLKDGRFGWLAPTYAGTYQAYVELPIDRLSYLVTPWVGYVWPNAGTGLPIRIERPVAERELAIEVHESMNVAGSLWFRITVLASSPCEAGESDTVARGWIPAYRPDGEPAVWFHSRGC